MPKVKYDVSDVEDAGEFAQAKPGMYVAKIKEANVKQSSKGDDMLEVIFVLTKDGKGKKLKEGEFGQLWSYFPLKPDEVHALWAAKLKEFIKALGLKAKGALDTDAIVGESIQVKTKMGTNEDGEPRAEITKWLPMPEAEDEDEDEDEAEEDEAEDDDDEESGEEYTEDDLGELDDDDLIEVATDEFELPKPKGKLTSAKRKKLIEAILEAQEGSEDEDEEDEEEEDEEGDGENADYTEWEIDDLKAELKERGLKVAGTKKVLISRLEKDDESDDEEPF